MVVYMYIHCTPHTFTTDAVQFAEKLCSSTTILLLFSTFDKWLIPKFGRELCNSDLQAMLELPALLANRNCKVLGQISVLAICHVECRKRHPKAKAKVPKSSADSKTADYGKLQKVKGANDITKAKMQADLDHQTTLPTKGG